MSALCTEFSFETLKNNKVSFLAIFFYSVSSLSCQLKKSILCCTRANGLSFCLPMGEHTHLTLSIHSAPLVCEQRNRLWQTTTLIQQKFTHYQTIYYRDPMEGKRWKGRERGKQLGMVLITIWRREGRDESH